MPTFDGLHNPKVVKKWLKEMGNNFNLMEVLAKVQLKEVTPFLVGNATLWWKGISPRLLEEMPIIGPNFVNHF